MTSLSITLLLCVSFTSAHPFHGRIFGGKTAQPGQFPFLVSIQVESDSENVHGHYCGASIINDQWVLTATHCVFGWTPDDIYLLAGTNLLDTGGTAYNVSKIIKHQDFNTTTIWNDIALIKIEGKFEFTDVVKTIGIGEVSGGQSSTIVGWGSTKDGDPNELQYTEVTTLTPDDCARLAEAAPYNLERGPGQVCALGSVDVGPCHGDSGGPLLFNNTVVGMVSYALDPACAKGYPDIYTRAAYYVEWIDESISLY